MKLTRRQMLITATAAPLAAAPERKRPAVCLFSKHLQELDYDQLADTCKEIGFDGIDLTVRAKGHVLPENAERDLPAAVEAIRKRGLTVPMISTDLLSGEDPTAESILRTASELGVERFKMGYYRYGDQSPFKAVADARKQVESLVPLVEKYGMIAGWHNHSGDCLGAATWDAHSIIRNLDKSVIGYYFDVGHSVIEGGKNAWRVASQIALTRLKMVAVKDFYWEKTGPDEWKTSWAPLGEGMVDWDWFFSLLAKKEFAGPISMHCEYRPQDKKVAFKRDLGYVRKLIEKHFQ